MSKTRAEKFNRILSRIPEIYTYKGVTPTNSDVLSHVIAATKPFQAKPLYETAVHFREIFLKLYGSGAVYDETGGFYHGVKQLVDEYSTVSKHSHLTDTVEAFRRKLT